MAKLKEIYPGLDDGSLHIARFEVAGGEEENIIDNGDDSAEIIGETFYNEVASQIEAEGYIPRGFIYFDPGTRTLEIECVGAIRVINNGQPVFIGPAAKWLADNDGDPEVAEMIAEVRQSGRNRSERVFPGSGNWIVISQVREVAK